MKVYKSIESLRREICRLKKRNISIGFVPTMGYLHDGHLSLIRKARKDTDSVIVSIFVNPIQFGAGEDFKRYPRDIKRDFNLCRANGADIVFMPSSESMYSPDFSTYISVERLTKNLCGASRPGHFKGVTTVVMKLFNIVSPDIAYFGQKDSQQAIVIKKMVKDLNMDIKIKVMPIVREKDGLAMSSRNAYLNNGEREEALSLHRSIILARELYKRGERDAKRITSKMKRLIAKNAHAKIDYVNIVDPDTLKDVKKISKKALVAVAVKIGKTRLIDNALLN